MGISTDALRLQRAISLLEEANIIHLFWAKATPSCAQGPLPTEPKKTVCNAGDQTGVGHGNVIIASIRLRLWMLIMLRTWYLNLKFRFERANICWTRILSASFRPALGKCANSFWPLEFLVKKNLLLTPHPTKGRLYSDFFQWTLIC